MVEWQGRSLQSRSYEEVLFNLSQRHFDKYCCKYFDKYFDKYFVKYFDKYFCKVRDIIAACRQDRAIELVVSRDSALAARRNPPREGLGEADLAR